MFDSFLTLQKSFMDGYVYFPTTVRSVEQKAAYRQPDTFSVPALFES